MCMYNFITIDYPIIELMQVTKTVYSIKLVPSHEDLVENQHWMRIGIADDAVGMGLFLHR